MRCGGVLKPNATGSPILRYRTRVPAASTRWASATMLRMAYVKRWTRAAVGIAAWAFAVVTAHFNPRGCEKRPERFNGCPTNMTTNHRQINDLQQRNVKST